MDSTRNVVNPAKAVWMPTVVEVTPRGEREWSVFSRLLKDRIIFLGDYIDDTLANVVIAQLLFLESEGPERDISIYINSPGGSLAAGLAIYDTIQYIKAPVTTLCVGQAVNMAAILLASGTRGKRFSLPHARFMMHQPLGGYSGQAMDIEITARELVRRRDELNQIVARHTQQPLDKVIRDTDRDFHMTAQEALEYGLIDQVFEVRK